jgi:hypothetical protein
MEQNCVRGCLEVIESLVELVGIEPTTSSLRILESEESGQSKKEHN